MNGSLRTPGYRKVLEQYGYVVTEHPVKKLIRALLDSFYRQAELRARTQFK